MSKPEREADKQEVIVQLFEQSLPLEDEGVFQNNLTPPLPLAWEKWRQIHMKKRQTKMNTMFQLQSWMKDLQLRVQLWMKDLQLTVPLPLQMSYQHLHDTCLFTTHATSNELPTYFPAMKLVGDGNSKGLNWKFMIFLFLVVVALVAAR
ncbi:hypothetical protein L1987_86943 [Smallanthus sonchifolius]|uniref:Uncharacterized protein n=1 Tax=Smallanthus sonchifolius TaxID=185202 RepID=A0ACB8Y0U1_9ASTR|nr:hypothetical protein L1987_86943 [Smallanthus sonchifolius]